MSTDIVHFDSTSMGKSGKNFQLGALQLYFAISIPLMATTLLAWYGVYWWETRKERQQAIPNPIKCEV